MTYKEAIAIENEFTKMLVVNVNVEHKGKVFVAHKMAIEALEKQSEIVHCKDCKNWEIITIETIRGEIAHAGKCALTGWLCGEQGYCMYGSEVE